MCTVAHSILKKSLPRKRKSMERRNGARADARYSARGGVRITTESERTIRYQTTTRSARAKSVALRLEIGSSGAVYSHHHRNFQKIGRIFALVFFAPHQRKPVRFGRAARFARVEGEVQKFKSRRFLEEGFFQGQVCNFYVRLTHPPIRAHVR